MAISVASRRRIFLSAVIVAICVAPAVARAQETTDREAIAHAKSLSRAFRAAAKRITPSVVTIQTKTNAKPPRADAPRENPFKGTPLEDLYPEWERRRRQPSSGIGSGVIIDSSGVVLTNHHVIEGADEVIVRLPDGREFKATDVRADSDTDLAVLRIKVKGKLPAAKLGDSDQLEIGDWVIAVGNPFELESTVSAGIISGKGRTLGRIRRAAFLQTDAAINPGNSGGPLVNLDGEIVGINTAIASSNGGYQGIGFAIPINLAKWVTPQLLKNGRVQRAFLGVSIADVEAKLARRLDVAPYSGVLVQQVFEDTPAAKAGMKEGDLITAFSGVKVRSARQLQLVVERAPLKSIQKVSILRDGKPQSVKVTIEPLPNALGRQPADE